jgi:uncharacterized protein (TIGR03437 family)
MNEEVLLYKYRFFVFAAILACLFGVQAASAQTPANVTVLSGNGQIYCSCPLTFQGFFGYEPLVVRVTDANNRPIAGATVNWSVASVSIGGFGQVNLATTTTATDGTTSNTFLPGGGVQPLSTQPASFQISATAGAASATFDLTQAYDASGQGGTIAENPTFLPATISTSPITGIAGQQGYSFNGQSGQSLRVGVVTPFGTPVPGVSLRIANYAGSSASAACSTGPGADPGSVLTDSTGYAVCTPVFSGSGPGVFELVIGGVPLCGCSQDPANPSLVTGGLLTYYLNVPPAIFYQVTPASPGSISVVSGSGQSASAGQQVPFALVAAVNAQTGGTLSGQNVVWSVSPAGAGTLASTTGTSDANGQVSNTLTLSSNASGPVTVTVALAANSTIKNSFNITAIPLITLTGLSKVPGGDGQTAVVNTPFANPLAVVVTSSTGAVVPGITVSFSTTGGLLSATSVTTGSNGQAQVTLTAGNNAGTYTVTASVAGLNPVTFTLTVTPPGPTFTANSFVNAADLKVGSLSPCSLATINAASIAPGIQGMVTANMFGLGGLPTTLQGDSVTIGGTPAPILSVGTSNNQQQLTFQVPCGTPTGSNAVAVTVNGGGSGSTTVNVLPVSPGVFQTGTILTLSSGATYPMGVFVRPDGSYVTQANAARKGETITAYVTGLGAASPSVNTNTLPLPTAISTANLNPVVGVANAGVQVVSAQLSPDLVGVYLVTFQLPASAPSGNQVFSVGVASGGQTYYSAGAAIPIL